MKSTRTKNFVFLLGAVAGVAAISARAQYNMVMTAAENPGATNSSLADTTVETFNEFNLGGKQVADFTNAVTSIGTYDLLTVRTANEYGGAAGPSYPDGSQYAVTSTSSSLGGIPTTTLTLNQQSAYFGLWWSAGDAQNFLNFYNGSTLVASFSTQTLMDMLPRAYYGNPTPGSLHGQDAGEPFGFINFYGVGGTTFNKVVFSDPSGSGFENDNNTVRAAAFGSDTNDVGTTLPGVPVEEVINNGGSQTVITNRSDFQAPVDLTAQMAPEPGVNALLGLTAVVAGVRYGRRRSVRA
jgi:hypothetical protein